MNRRSAGRAWMIGTAAVALCLAVPSPMSAQSTLDCQRCHGELELLRQNAPTLERARELLVGSDVVRVSAHGDMTCAECHGGYGSYPHPDRTNDRSCASCHEDAAAAWGGGVHGRTDDPDAAGCGSCHGVHDVASDSALAEPAELAAMNARCVTCHGDQALPADDPHDGEVACFECHDAHAIEPPAEEGSLLAGAAQPRACGACHDSVAGRWVEDAHGRALLDGTSREAAVEPPTCTTCHGAHGMPAAGTESFVLVAGDRCAECHEGYAETFLDSYHGQATALGSELAATCADCHGAHGIFPASEARSMVSDARRLETCRSCHPDATPSFAGFEPHADPHDREKNPVLYWTYLGMTALLVGVLGLFGAHTALWLTRLALDAGKRRRSPGRTSAPVERD